MKRLSRKKHQRDKSVLLARRTHRQALRAANGKKKRKPAVAQYPSKDPWIEKLSHLLDIEKHGKNGIILKLPVTMNLSSEYEVTAANLAVIRHLVRTKHPARSISWLAKVDFGKLQSISTSAALALTAELSRWEDSLRGPLRPLVGNWHEQVYDSFSELGFFDLFSKTPARPILSTGSKELSLVRYAKGSGSDADSAKKLKARIKSVVGEEVAKWRFLRHGIDEAMLNVIHHAYPETEEYAEKHKNWYLTGSYNVKTKQLKIVFYDQGIGIPNALPASNLYESALTFCKSIGGLEGINDATLIKASMEMARTRTGESDRGKGLPDMLDFIKQRKDGYMSVISGKGLYKYTIDGDDSQIKTASFENRINGTMIIWCVTLQQ